MAKKQEKFFESKNDWSAIKDKLLQGYLTPYFQKVLMTRKPIYYVDCFAGKGKFNDGQPGSPRIALQSRDNALRNTTLADIKDVIEMCFIELHHANELKGNLEGFHNRNGVPQVISGKYENEIVNLLSTKQDTNVFLYIDPYGIKALDIEMFEKFKDFDFKSLEMLINFNSFGFIRSCCSALGVSYASDKALLDLEDLVEYEPTEITKSSQSELLLSRIVGGDYWKDIVHDYNAKKIDGYEAEQRLSAQYKQRLKEIYGYVLDMPIRTKAGHRPKYRMIHVTNHEDGCFLMAENMQKRKDELFTNIQQGHRNTLFDVVDTLDVTFENKVISSSDVKEKIKQSLSNAFEGVGLKRFLASFVNEHGILCEFKMMHAALDELAQEGYIMIKRTPAISKTGKPRTFWEENKNQSVNIKRK